MTGVHFASTLDDDSRGHRGCMPATRTRPAAITSAATARPSESNKLKSVRRRLT